MFFRLFNWLVKKIPYTLTVVTIGNLWGIFAATFGGLLILERADFEATGTKGVFILSLSLAVVIAIFLKSSEHGLFRFLGIKRERKEIKVLNDNIFKGQIISNLSTETLLEIHHSINKVNRWMTKRHIQYGLMVVIFVVLMEWLTSGNLTNFPIISIAGLTALSIMWIGLVILYESLLAPIRKQCKFLLIKRGLSFKKIEETHFLSLKIKSNFFILLVFLTIVTILIIIYPLKLSIVILSILSLFIISILTNWLFDSIYKSFIEIKESAKDLEMGKRAIFFTGSLDEEIIDLSKSLNKAADELYKNRKQLEESKTTLEIKVKART